MEAPSGFALPGVPSGDGGAGGRRGEATDTAPRRTRGTAQARRRAEHTQKRRAPGGEKAALCAAQGARRERNTRAARRGQASAPTGGREAPSPRPQRRKGKRSAPAQSKGKGKRSGRSERRGSATARTKPERRSGGSERRTRVEWARPPAADEPRKRSAARRQDARWDKAPATAKPTRRDEREPGQARKTTFVERGQSARAGTTGAGGGKIAPGTRPGAIAPTEWEPLGSWACVVQSCAAVSARLVRAAISAAQPPLYAAGKSSVMRRDSVT